MTGAMSDDETKHKAEGEALKIGDEPTPKIRRKIENLNAFVYRKKKKKKKGRCARRQNSFDVSRERSSREKKKRPERWG